MRIKEEIKRLGYFWFPAESDTKFPGTLSIFDGGIIELELIYARGSEIRALGERWERIVGQIEKEDFVTLDLCEFRKGEHLNGISKILYNVKMAITGVPYKEGEKSCFKSLSFSVEGLDDWVGLNEVTIDGLPRGEGTITLSYNQPEHIEINLENGMQLFIMSTFTCPGRFSINKDYTLSQKVEEFNICPVTSFTLSAPDGRAFQEFKPVVKEITAFLCFAANRFVCINSMSAEAVNPHRDIIDGATRMAPNKIYYESWPHSKDEPESPRPKSIEFSVLKDHGEKIIKKWRAIFEQIEPALNLYLLALTGAHPTSQGRFLALAQALEACHRRINGGTESFGERIENIVEPYTEIVGNKETQRELICKIANTRTYFTHYLSNREPKAAKGEELRHLCFKMEYFFQLYILQLLDFNTPHPSLDRFLASEFFIPETPEPKM